jgi:hypothetical protein
MQVQLGVLDAAQVVDGEFNEAQDGAGLTEAGNFAGGVTWQVGPEPPPGGVRSTAFSAARKPAALDGRRPRTVSRRAAQTPVPCPYTATA